MRRADPDPQPPAVRSRLSPATPAFTLLLGALVTLASFATDMGLPVLADTARDLGVAPATAALTFSVFMAGYAIGPLAFGPLSDRVGRRPVLLAGLAAFAGFGGLAAFAGSLPVLLAWRLLMGVGAGTCQTLVVAVIRDLFQGTAARARQSYVSIAGGVAPIVAPTVGVWIAGAGGWRGIYAALALGGTALLAAAAFGLGESAARSAAPLTARGVGASYARVLRHPVSAGYIGVAALGFGSIFAYVSGSSLLLIQLLGVSQRAYGLLFGAGSFGFMAGAFLNTRLLHRGVPHARMLTGGLGVAAATALGALAISVAGAVRVWTLVPLIVLGNVGLGAARPNASQGALEPVPEIAGVASAVLSALQMLAGAAASAAVAALFDGRTATAVTGIMALCAVGAFAVYVGVVRPAERRSGALAPTAEAAAADAHAAGEEATLAA